MIRRTRLISVPVVSGRPTMGSFEMPRLLFEVGLTEDLKKEGIELEETREISVPKLRGESGPDPKASYLRQVSEIATHAYNGLRDTLQEEEFPVFLGGDCGICLATFRETARVHDGLNVVWLDAHGDFNTPETTPSGYLGGMVLAAALGRGAPELTSLGDTGPPVPEERVGLMAIRALDEEEQASLEESRVRFTLFERRGDLKGTVGEFLEETDGPIFLHFDVDSIDPQDLPHVSFRAPRGPRTPEVRESLMSVAKSRRLVALEVASLDATQKHAGSSASLISGILAETVAASR